MKAKPIILLSIAALCGGSVHAADQYWYGNAQNWTTNANWSSTDVSGGAQTWVSGNNAFFASVANRVQVNADVTANNVTVTKANMDFRFTGSRNINVGGTWSDLSTTTYGLNTTTATNYVFTFTSDLDSTLNGKFNRTGTGTGTLGFTKAGNGSVTLAGLTTSATLGPISVTSGKLIITGAVNTFSSLSVSNGATLAGESADLGVTNGKVSAITLNGGVSTGGMLAPGNGIAGDLGSLYGTSLTWNGSNTTAFSQMLFNLATNSASSDQLFLSGVMTKGTGSFFQFDFGGTGDTSVARTYTLLTTGAGGLSGWSNSDFSYTGLDAGITSGSFNISGDSLQFTTVVIPEPRAALLGGFGLLGLLRRRRG